MQDSEFDSRLERVRKAAEVIGDLPTEALQADAFHYLLGSTSGPLVEEVEGVGNADQAAGPEFATAGEADANTTEKPGNTSAKKPGVRKGKPANVNPDKTLDLTPAGKQSFAEFVAEKKPVSHIEKYTASVYWMLEVAEYDKATIAQIVTCYHAAKWVLSANIRNTAAQAGRKHLDNSSGLDDIKLSSLGRNLVLGMTNATK